MDNPKDMRYDIGIFLHANRDLTEFQREVIELVFVEKNYPRAIARINEQITLLMDAQWSPSKLGGDMVMTPAHYDRFPIEPTFFIFVNKIDWLRGNFLKYVCRYPFKNGIEDLRKAMRNLAMLVNFLDGNPKWSR